MKEKKIKRHVFVFSFMVILFKRFASLGFLKISTILKNRGTQAWDTPRDVPWAYQGNEWVGSDHVKSFGIKVRSAPLTCCGPSPESREVKWPLASSILKQAQWLKENNFGGATVSAIDLDDFASTFCNQGKFPLINTLKKAVGLQSASKWKQKDARGIQLLLL